MCECVCVYSHIDSIRFEGSIAERVRPRLGQTAVVLSYHVHV